MMFFDYLKYIYRYEHCTVQPSKEAVQGDN